MQALPQVIYLALVALSVGISMARYGERKRDSYGIVDVIVAPALTLALLWWGGFFAPLLGAS